MKTNELNERLRTLNNMLFSMHMIDRWTSKDLKTINRIEREIEEIKKILGE